jgi:phosphoglycolate phosphatase
MKACIIDLDGTLVHTLGDFVASLNHMLTDLGLPEVDANTVERAIGQGSGHLVSKVLAHQLALPEVLAGGTVLLSWPEDQRNALALERYQHHYGFNNGQHSAVYPGVLEGLQRLQQAGVRLACLTNKPVGFARDLLELKGLLGFFEHVFGGDSFERKKPDPLPVLRTCEALGTAPTDTWMVGDSSNDAQAATGAGSPVVLVSYGYNHGEPVRELAARACVDRLDEIDPAWA